MAVLTATDDTSELLTVAETMAKLRCSESTVRRLIATGELPAVRVGSARLVRVPQVGLDALLEPVGGSDAQ
jgi:excisionase family DNA binding protein